MNSKLIFINTNEPTSSDGSSSTYILRKNEERENVPNTTSENMELPHLPTHAVESHIHELLFESKVKYHQTERPRCYKKMAATKLPPDKSLDSGTYIITSSLHAASEVLQLDGKVMMEKHSKFTFYRLKGYHSLKKGERKQVVDNDAKEKEAILALKVNKSPLTFQQAASKKGAQQQTDISTTMSQASDLSALHKEPSLTVAPDKSNTIQSLENTSNSASVKVAKTKSNSKLLDDKLSMPSNNKIEITKKIGEKKTGSKRKGNSCNDKKRGSKHFF